MLFLTAVFLSLILPITSFADAQGDAKRKQAVTDNFSSLTFTDTTLSEFAFEYEISQKKNVYRIDRPGESAYVTSGSLSGVSGFVDDISSVEFYGPSSYFFTFSDLLIDGKQYWISMKYDAAKLLDETELKNLDQSLSYFLADFNQKRTAENLAACAEKHLSSYTIGPYTKDRVCLDSTYRFKSEHGGRTVFPQMDSGGSALYSFSEHGPYINASGSAPQVSSAGDLFGNKFPSQVAAIRFENSYIGGTDYWVICRYEKKAKNASLSSEIKRALEQTEVVFEKEDARECGATDEEISLIDITTIDDVPEVVAEEEKEFVLPDTGSFIYSSLDKDPLSYIDDFSFADTEGAGERELKSIAGSFYDLIVAVSIAGYAMAAIFGAVGLMAKGQQVRNQFLDMILEKTALLAILAGISGILGTCITIIETVL